MLWDFNFLMLYIFTTFITSACRSLLDFQCMSSIFFFVFLFYHSDGWLQDHSGKWVKDENVEFDSDEEEPLTLAPAPANK